MTAVYAALLGILQGLTEFLPVSSSAHLILGRAVLGWDAERFGLAFDVACHVGTLLALLAYFRADLRAMASAAPRLLTTFATFRRGDEPPPPPQARQLWLILVGTLPIILVGLLFDDFLQRTVRTPAVAAVALAIGAVFLMIAERVGRHSREEDSLTGREAILLGVAQAAALIPGVSRSGATMTVGMLAGLRRDAAARFTFLLGIPAVIVAAGREALALVGEPITAEVYGLFAIGVVTSGIVGYLTVKYFLRYLTRHSLDVFAAYRLALAAATWIWMGTP